MKHVSLPYKSALTFSLDHALSYRYESLSGILQEISDLEDIPGTATNVIETDSLQELIDMDVQFESMKSDFVVDTTQRIDVHPAENFKELRELTQKLKKVHWQQ